MMELKSVILEKLKNIVDYSTENKIIFEFE